MWGGNAIEEYIDDAAKLRAHWKRLKPPVMLIMSDTGSTRLARDVKQDLPETEVIFRPYHPQDHRFHEYRSADEIWDMHRPYAADGLVVQVWNEPSGYSNLPTLAGKAASVAKYARQEGKRVALPTFAVGHPGEVQLAAGELDPLLREMAADTRAKPHLWATHEYGLTTTASDPYRVGRVAAVLKRAAAIGAPINPRRVAMTEYGRDVGGHADSDGWAVYFNGDQTAYFHWMLPGIELYRAAGYLGVCIFVYGRTWRSFDIQRAETLWQLMEAWNAANPRKEYPVTQPTIPAPTTGGIKGVIASLPQGVAWRNIRTQPYASAADIGDLKANEDIIAYVNARTNDDWCYFERLSDGVKGWTLWAGVVFAPELLPPDPQPEPTTYPLTEAQYEALSDYVTRAEADMKAARALLEGVKPSDADGKF